MTNVEELWQGYTLQGEPEATPVTLPAAAKGALHGASHVWIWRETARGLEVLLQKRAANKRTWPGFYDISAAGHITFGDAPLMTALRETEEEIGVKIKPENLRLLFVHRQHFISPDRHKTQENEFRWVYAYQLNADNKFVFQDGEVEDVWWVDLEELRQLIAGVNLKKQIVPQGEIYFNTLLEGLRRFAHP